ncbi:MAG: hypothetical protein V4467_01340 [Patescibacteria group bacterium]
MTKILKFFDHLEDKTRGQLSHVPILYALIGAVSIVLFWRGIWDLADILALKGGLWAIIFDPIISLLISMIILLGTGIFVSFFIGDRIIMSGLKHEKKVEEKTESEVRDEEVLIHVLHKKVDLLTQGLEDIKRMLNR